jgi:Fic family protein
VPQRGLHSFIEESNRIEGINGVTDLEVDAHAAFLALKRIRVADVVGFVETVAGAEPRFREGRNVRVGNHFPQPGGEGIRVGLQEVLKRANDSNPDLDTPWAVHVAYERLHPFMDGNGRSGRVLWAWMRLKEGRDPFLLGFLHAAYYEALEAGRS